MKEPIKFDPISFMADANDTLDGWSFAIDAGYLADPTIK